MTNKTQLVCKAKSSSQWVLLKVSFNKKEGKSFGKEQEFLMVMAEERNGFEKKFGNN